MQAAWDTFQILLLLDTGVAIYQELKLSIASRYATSLNYADDAARFFDDLAELTKVRVYNRAGKAFSGGKAGEKYLADMVGGKSQVYFKTSLGGRYIDQLSNEIAYESKVGYTTLTSRVRKQILKDSELIKKGLIDGAEWHFFRSVDTGKIGASRTLVDFLKQNGIKYIIHY